MKTESTSRLADQIEADAIVVSVREGNPLPPAAAEIDRASGGLLQRLVTSGEVSTRELSCTRLPGVPGVKAGVVLVVGLGKPPTSAANHGREGLGYRAAAAAARALAARPRKSVGFGLDLHPLEDVVAGAITGCSGQDLYRREKNITPFERLLFAGALAVDLQRGGSLGHSINLTRRLVNQPASEIFPESFAEEVQRVAQGCGCTAEIWDRHRLEKERCGALLAVAKGSDREPRLAIIDWQGNPGGGPPLALVGKGVTFDSGGLSLKPADAMLDMKCDMAGAATVLGAVQTIAQLKLPVNVTGYMGLVENMVSGNSYRVGDVLVARNGKTIEVHNTDAEGRLVLADVLDVALSRGVARIVDLATLTGACMVALGKHVVGGMTNHQAWYDRVAAAPAAVGESVWQLPMFAEYGDQIKGQVADIKNVGDGRWGGAITAAKFLEQFVGDTPWVHLDIAGPAFLDKPLPWCDGGATGYMLRTLVELASGLASGQE
jgi:leucyl aminopeptidase